jgi:microcompartment protein CcmL/EutN
MHDCIGLLESRSIARGVEAADFMAKEAPVELLWTRIFEPGRHLTLVTGPVDDVRQSLRRGRERLGDDLVDELFLPAAHPSLFDALEAARPRERDAMQISGERALGLIECASVAATLHAADGAAKEAPVALVALRIGPDMGGKGVLALTGDVADVESAVARGAALAEARGALVRIAVIPRPAEPILERVLHL